MGILFVALGVALCSKADLGVSMIAAPTFVIYEFLAPKLPFLSVGMTEYIIQGLLIAAMCLATGRFHWRYLLSFAVAVLYGYVLNLCMFFTEAFVITAPWQRWLLLLLGDIVCGFGVACFFGTYMPLQAFELFVAEVCDRFHLDITRFKTIFDYSLLGISILLALVLFRDVTVFPWETIGYHSYHSLGLGTLVTTVINSPIIYLMGKLVRKTFDPSPLLPGLQNFLIK